MVLLPRKVSGAFKKQLSPHPPPRVTFYPTLGLDFYYPCNNLQTFGLTLISDNLRQSGKGYSTIIRESHLLLHSYWFIRVLQL